VVDRRALGSAYSLHELAGGSSAYAHTHPHTIYAGLNQVQHLSCGHHIAANDIEVGVLLLDELDQGDLIPTVALLRVYHDHIHPCQR
jgi:hypothetical protein